MYEHFSNFNIAAKQWFKVCATHRRYIWLKVWIINNVNQHWFEVYAGQDLDLKYYNDEVFGLFLIHEDTPTLNDCIMFHYLLCFLTWEWNNFWYYEQFTIAKTCGLKRGQKIEVQGVEDGFYGTWFLVTFLKRFLEKCFMRYDEFVNENENSNGTNFTTSTSFAK